MKLTSKKNTMFFAICTIFFMGCSDDDSNEDQIFDVVSEVVYDGETYGLDNAFVEYGGENFEVDSYEIELYMTASSVIFNEEYQSLNGTGAFLNIDFNSEAEEELVSGIYTYIEKQEERAAFTFSGAEFLVDFSSVDYEDVVNVTGGTVKVTTKGDVVALAIDLTTENSTIKGNFSNTVEVIEQ